MTKDDKKIQDLRNLWVTYDNTEIALERAYRTKSLLERFDKTNRREYVKLYVSDHNSNSDWPSGSFIDFKPTDEELAMLKAMVDRHIKEAELEFRILKTACWPNLDRDNNA